jgi:lipopolysaccharide biosynthesis glycosyltransferase
MFDVLPVEYDSFVFRDADTIVLIDIDQGFEKAEKHGIAAVQATAYGLEHYLGFKKILNEVGINSREILQYNSGVIFFTRSPSAWRVLKKWHEFCSAADRDEPAWGDQPYLTLALELLGFNPYTLSIAYNYRNFGELVSGRIRVWHSHTPPPEDVNRFEHPCPLVRRIRA